MNDLRFLSALEAVNLRRGYLVTVNMQHLYSAYENPGWRETFFRSPMASLCADGRGAHSLLEASQNRRLPILAGNEALETALKSASGRRVLVIGSSSDAVAGTAHRYPQVTFEHIDGRFDISTRANAHDAAAALTARFDPKETFALVAIALGVGKQELLAEAMAPMVDAPIYCIGGSFEMLAGSLKRAPSWVRRLGLEGVWRLALQPNSARLERLVKSYGYYVLFRLHILNIRNVLERSA